MGHLSLFRLATKSIRAGEGIHYSIMMVSWSMLLSRIDFSLVLERVS
jgi:hypothetical protein